MNKKKKKILPKQVVSVLCTGSAWAYGMHLTTKTSYCVVRQLGCYVSIKKDAVVKDVLFFGLTGDFDASELSDGEQSKVCSCRFAFHLLHICYMLFKQLYLKKTWVV